MCSRFISGVAVSAIGLGALPMSDSRRLRRADGSDPHDATRAMHTIHAALDAGVRLIDTADAYAPDGKPMGHNERLIADALRRWGGDRTAVLVATKGGHTRHPDGGWGVDGRPEHLRQACEASLRRLDLEAIGLYQLHRPDPRVPFAESVGVLRDLQQEGKVRLVGISNCNCAQIKEAAGIVTLASVQNQLSPQFRSSLPEVDLCTKLGVAFLAWSPLGGMVDVNELGSRNAAFGAVARERDVSPQQVALAWELALSPLVIPIPGASRADSILDSIRASDLELSVDELARLNHTVKASTSAY